jgi:MATE family multidrug resistance protein
MEAATGEAPLLQPRGGGDGSTATTARGRATRRAAVEWWVESKKLWRIVGPAIFQRIALYGINVVSQAFIGHLGDLELAAFSIAATVIAGFNFGFLVHAAPPPPFCSDSVWKELSSCTHILPESMLNLARIFSFQ